VKELIIFAAPETTPLTMVVIMLPLDVASLLLIIVLVPTEPPMLEVIMFARDESILDTFKFVTDRLVAVALDASKLLILLLVSTESVIVALSIVAVANVPPDPTRSVPHSNILVVELYNNLSVALLQLASPAPVIVPNVVLPPNILGPDVLRLVIVVVAKLLVP